jgi:glycosyltransferase involved in cell wall biosynthesis
VTKTPIMLLVAELGIGGCERDVTNIVLNLDHDRFSPHVGCFAARGLRYPQIAGAGIPIAEFPVTSLRKPSLLTHMRNLRSYLKKNQIALVHSWDIPTEMLAVPVAWFSGVPAIIKSHLWLSEYVPKAYSPVVRMNNHLAHKVLVNSEATRQDFLRWSGIPAGRTYVSHNGVDTRIFNPGQRAANPEVVVGTVCALRSEKRLDLLLRAFAAVREQRGGGVRLLMVGSGPMEGELKALRDQLGIADACEFVPSQSDIPPWMRKIDVFVISSQGESLPNALLEAMASGCCVVASKVGGIPEVVLDGETGLLAQPGDLDGFVRQIGRAVNDSELRLRLGHAAADRAAQEFSIAKAVGRIERLYTDLLSAKRLPQPSGAQSAAV